jgi:hypothetical protein
MHYLTIHVHCCYYCAQDMIDGRDLVLPRLTEAALAEDLTSYYELAPAGAERRGSYAVKRPWLAAAPPSAGAPLPPPPPEDDLSLAWIHG